MNFKLKCFLPLVLCFTLFLGSTCFASGARGISANLYSDNALNSQVIREFNNFSVDEQTKLLQDLFPLITLRLGFKQSDPYSVLNGFYQIKRGVKQSLFDSADDYFNNSNDSYSEKYYFVYLEDGHYHWYTQLSQYLINVISVNNDTLVVNDTSGLNYIMSEYVNNYASDHGIIDISLHSAYRINSNGFFNKLSQYNSFIDLCNQYKSSKYVVIARATDYLLVGFPKINANLYLTSVPISSDVSNIWLCSDNGINFKSNNFTWFYSQASYTSVGEGDRFSIVSQMNSARSFNYGFHNYGADLNTSATVGSYSGNSNVNNTNWGIYSLNNDNTVYSLFTSLAAWVDNQGHFEIPFEVTSYFGSVPSTTISSQDMTNTYINNYTDNSINNNSTVNNIYYPSDYVPDSNSYDSESHLLDFSGVGALISSIGNLIGSLINGIAQGIANILNAISTSARNLIENLSGGVIFEFLRAFLVWLPEPIPSLMFALFTLSVTFAVVRLVKGAFS